VISAYLRYSECMERLFKQKAIVALIGFGLVAANAVAWAYITEERVLEVIFFDVGQGDAIFIQTPQKHQILIDGGSDGIVLEKLGRILPFWDKSLDLVILTHPDKDHMGGLVRVLERQNVQNVLWTGVQKDTQVYEAWEDAIAEERREGANIQLVKENVRISWSKDPRAYIDILYPMKIEDIGASEINDTSIVSKLVFGETSFLFTGDISKKIESKFVEQHTDIDVDVLQIAHHGSNTSSGEKYLVAASPDLGIIQVGNKNRYGHPHKDVLARIARLRIPVLRTDQNGDIIVRSDGNSLYVKVAHEQ